MIRINPALEASVLAADFARRGRLQVRDFFVAEDAEGIHDMLDRQTPWWLVYNVGGRVEELPPERLARMTQGEFNQILLGVQERARTQFQFLYQTYPLVPTYFAPNAAKLPIHGVYEFLNSAPALDFFRTLTGHPDIRWADGQATLYRSGNFLKSHSDQHPRDRRVAAFVLNFTKLWERDWGGYLQFFDDAHDVEQGYRPIFNALNIFTVPMDHNVGVVSPFAYGMRYSVTGWLRSDDPPGPFGRAAL